MVNVGSLEVGARFRFPGEEIVHEVAELRGDRVLVRAALVNWSFQPTETVSATEPVEPVK